MPRVEQEVAVKSQQGLHARPAALFVQIAVKYNSLITVSKEEESVNGKSIMGILMLGAEHNSKIRIVAEGDDAQAAVDELVNFIATHE